MGVTARGVTAWHGGLRLVLRTSYPAYKVYVTLMLVESPTILLLAFTFHPCASVADSKEYPVLYINEMRLAIKMLTSDELE